VRSKRHQTWACWIGVSALLAVAGLAAGCGDDEEPSPYGEVTEQCGEDFSKGCVGFVEDAALCDGEYCPSGVECSDIVEVSDDPGLQQAADGATAGTCIALTRGIYGGVSLPGGVSLLGLGPDFVELEGTVTLNGGSDATIRGLTVRGGGVVLEGAAAVRLSSLRITESEGTGVELRGGASAEIAFSEIVDAGEYGVLASDSESLTLTNTKITGSASSAVWVSPCDDGCDCATRPTVSVTEALMGDNGNVTLALLGAEASITGVEIADTHPADLQGGGGLAIAECSMATVEDLDIHGSRQWGLLVDGADAVIGRPGVTDGIIIYDNEIGVWMQNVTGSQQVKLEGADIYDNAAVGLGVSGASQGIIIYDNKIRDTSSSSVPVYPGGSQSIGHGFVWSNIGDGGADEASQVEIDGLSLSGNAGASFLIDGPVAPGSSIANVTQSGGDSEFIQQNLASGEQQPNVGSGTPSLMTSDVAVEEVPLPPEGASAL